MFKLIALILLAALLLLVAYASTRPDDFKVERSIVVQAPAERVFTMVNDLEQFNRWNPWLRKDPKTVQRYGDKRAGVGAFYAWESREIGVGSMEISASQPSTRIEMKLDFIRPFEAHNQVVFSLSPEGQGQRLVWAMSGKNNFIGKLMGLVFNMDRMVGSDFEAGLAELKQLAEHTEQGQQP
ncbi:SRPBCC family protein [Paucibacter sp. APW11]|uniref:SRPBCC family protein n=1 Tax=Roseateles aquae TaxID=3077235 RepID=A0ABU3PJZ7_9BURK|nr:SRPBCC family protein [Paucibacter sp. APW11]MDT9002458.1 SRPBCC family protein [Paucibacter sp. APW11]